MDKEIARLHLQPGNHGTRLFLCLLFLAGGSHCSLLLGGFLLGGVVAGDSELRELNADAVGAGLDDDRVILHGHDVADDAADGRDVVADLQRIAHGLCFLLPLVFRADHEEVEDRDQRDHHDDKRKVAAAGGCAALRIVPDGTASRPLTAGFCACRSCYGTPTLLNSTVYFLRLRQRPSPAFARGLLAVRKILKNIS